MRKFIVLAAILGATGCAMMATGGPPIPTPPATPVFFQPYSSSLDQAALTTIATAAKAAAEEPNDKVVVVGAADNTGATDANKALSKARAQTVAGQLGTDGVDPARIHAYGIGETGAPMDMTQYSRRAIIVISP
jgi:outer membrane protein OmpA-like peptidoglycan-associated protein